jgi:hypothetical protein
VNVVPSSFWGIAICADESRRHVLRLGFNSEVDMKNTIALALLLSAVALTGCSVSPMGFGEAANTRSAGSEDLSAGGGRGAFPEDRNAAFGGISETNNQPGAIIQGDFDNGKALKQMFGTYNAETKRSVWKPKKEELGKFNFYDNVTSLQSRAVFSKSFQQGDNDRVIVVTRTAPPRDECEDCVPVLGAAIYTKLGDEWHLDSQAKAISRTGQHGELSGGKLVKISPNKYGVLFSWKHSNMGVAEEGTMLLAETKSGLKEIFSMVTGSNNKAYCQENGLYENDPECWGFSSKVELVKSETSPYYDVKVTTQGTKQVDQGEVANVRETRRFAYSETGYRQLRNRE